MRAGNKPQLIRTAENHLVGVNLGADFTAEHEWGIKELKDKFGISSDIAVYGLPRRKITHVAKELHWIAEDIIAGFICERYSFQEPQSKLSHHQKEELRLYESTKNYTGSTLAGAWDEGSFGVISNQQETIEAIQEIYDEFKNHNIVLTLSSALIAFENSGLIIAIADRLPPTVIEQWYKDDKERHEIEQAVEATGIKKLLQERGKHYFALTGYHDTDGSLKFWLNPMEQKKNNSGWFKLEDLREWADNKGPIVGQND